jgi:hypothetical protein
MKDTTSKRKNVRRCFHGPLGNRRLLGAWNWAREGTTDRSIERAERRGADDARRGAVEARRGADEARRGADEAPRRCGGVRRVVCCCGVVGGGRASGLVTEAFLER